MRDAKEILEDYMKVKEFENECKKRRVEIEEEILQLYKNGTTHDLGFCVQITQTKKYKLCGEVPEGVDIMKISVDETKLKKYCNADWVEVVDYKPTVKVTKECL